MKTTGHTTEGNFIVEMTYQEHYLLTLLSQTIEGKELDHFPQRLDGTISLDMSTVLGVIWNFVQIKDFTNKLLHAIQDVDKMLLEEKELKTEGDKLMDFFK